MENQKHYTYLFPRILQSVVDFTGKNNEHYRILFIEDLFEKYFKLADLKILKILYCKNYEYYANQIVVF